VVWLNTQLLAQSISQRVPAPQQVQPAHARIAARINPPLAGLTRPAQDSTTFGNRRAEKVLCSKPLCKSNTNARQTDIYNWSGSNADVAGRPRARANVAGRLPFLWGQAIEGNS